MSSTSPTPRPTRRTSLRLAAAGAAGVTAAGLVALSPALADGDGHGPRPGPHPEPGAHLAPGVTAHVAVTATTLWVDPDTDRPGIDDPSLGNPVDLDVWNQNIRTPRPVAG